MCFGFFEFWGFNNVRAWDLGILGFGDLDLEFGIAGFESYVTAARAPPQGFFPHICSLCLCVWCICCVFRF